MKKLFLWCAVSLTALLNMACSDNSSHTEAPSFVSLQVTPAQGRIPVGFEQQFIAQATLSDGSVIDVTRDPRLSWKISDDFIATIDDKGMALAVTIGTVTVTASGNTVDGHSVSATAQLEVTSAHATALQLTPATSTIPIGLEQAFTATALMSDGSTLDVTSFAGLHWGSSNENVAIVDDADRKGVATGVAPGSSIISASGSANGMSFSATAELMVSNATVKSLKVTPEEPVVPIGLSQQFTVAAVLSDGSSMDVTRHAAVSWASSDAVIASINNNDNKGLAMGSHIGTTTIKATGTLNGKSMSAETQLTVSDVVVTDLTVTPTTPSIAAGMGQQFLATAQLSDGTTMDVTKNAALNWTSSNPQIATVGSVLTNLKGLARGGSPGTTTITASGGANRVVFTASAELTVTDAVVRRLLVTPMTVTIGVSQTQQFQAMAIFSDGSMQNVTNALVINWSSSDPTIATVTSNRGSGNGIATGVRPGDVTITASGVTEETPFSVSVPLKVITAGNVVTWGDPADGGDSSAVKGDLVDVKQIFSTSNAFAALRSDGTVVTWGNVLYGADSSTVKDDLVDVKQIFSTRNAFAALRADGSVVTWGDVGYGGDSSAVVGDLVNVEQILSTDSAFAALRSDGSVVTWGDPDNGGDSSAVKGDLINVEQISFTPFSFAALKSDGSVVTWGDSANGGNSSAVQDELNNVEQIFSTRYSFAALKSDGSVVTWGVASNGGNSSAVQNDLVNIEKIFSTDTAFAAQRVDGRIVTWGDDGGDSSEVELLLTDVKQIFSTTKAFAALRADGTVVTWGGANHGGDSSSVKLDLIDVKTLFSTNFAFAALKQDGIVVTWGSENSGGNSSSVQNDLVNVERVFSTWQAFAALTANGSVVTWGLTEGGGNSSAVQGELVDVVTIYSSAKAFAAIKENP